MKKMEKMEIFQRNLETLNLSKDFIKKALDYFNELEDEKEANDFFNKVEEVIDDYNRSGSFTYNTIQSELNLKDLRKDIALLKNEYPELDLNLYFRNIEAFEISILYVLYEFYEDDEDDE